ncbi:MAG TPA: DinB family protein [Thermomicrobiales bacterium]|nr:DinB family protein [Thermomicrobiales bacterium]
MTATRTVTILTPDRLTSLGQAFFAAQKTGEPWRCDAGIDDLAATILERRERLRAVVAGAPEASFGPQPDNDQGEQVWTAGQCAEHVCAAQYAVGTPAILSLTTPGGVATFAQPAPPNEVPAPPALSRAAALARLDAATPEFAQLLDRVPRDADLDITLDHRFFGTINLAALLLICAWHEQGHAAQIERLSA